MEEKKYPTGIHGFDKLIGGGFITGQKVVILGAPGTCKSIFCAQFIYNGITKFGEPGVYVSTQEKRDDFYRNMLNFGMDFQKLEDEGKFIFIEQGFVKKEYFDILKVLKNIHKIGAKRVVYDSLNFFDVKYPDIETRNLEILSYMRGLSGKGRISLWVSENYEEGKLRYQPAHFLSDGLIYMQHLLAHKGPYFRTITVMKLRGRKHDDNRYPFNIESNGIQLKKI